MGFELFEGQSVGDRAEAVSSVSRANQDIGQCVGRGAICDGGMNLRRIESRDQRAIVSHLSIDESAHQHVLDYGGVGVCSLARSDQCKARKNLGLARPLGLEDRG